MTASTREGGLSSCSEQALVGSGCSGAPGNPYTCTRTREHAHGSGPGCRVMPRHGSGRCLADVLEPVR
jgi:hypothetical protein